MLVVTQWQSTGCTSQVSWVQSPAAFSLSSIFASKNLRQEQQNGSHASLVLVLHWLSLAVQRSPWWPHLLLLITWFHLRAAFLGEAVSCIQGLIIIFMLQMGHLRIMNALTCPWVYLPYAFPNMEWTNAYGYVVVMLILVLGLAPFTWTMLAALAVRTAWLTAPEALLSTVTEATQRMLEWDVKVYMATFEQFFVT